MKIFKLLCCFWGIQLSLLGQNITKIQDFVKVDLSNEKIIQINEAASQVLAEIPIQYRDNFKIFEYGFAKFSDILIGEGSIESSWEKAKVEAQNASQFYFLIGYQFVTDDASLGYRLQINLPIEGEFSCLNKAKRNLLGTEILLESKFDSEKRGTFNHAENLIILLNEAKNTIRQIIECCNSNNPSPCSEIDPDARRIRLYENGFIPIPLDSLILDNSIALQSQINNRSNQEIENFSGSINAIVSGNSYDIIQNVSTFLSSLQEGASLSKKIRFLSNKNMEGNDVFGREMQEFNNETNYDINTIFYFDEYDKFLYLLDQSKVEIQIACTDTTKPSPGFNYLGSFGVNPPIWKMTARAPGYMDQLANSFFEREYINVGLKFAESRQIPYGNIYEFSFNNTRDKTVLNYPFEILFLHEDKRINSTSSLPLKHIFSTPSITSVSYCKPFPNQGIQHSAYCKIDEPNNNLWVEDENGYVVPIILNEDLSHLPKFTYYDDIFFGASLLFSPPQTKVTSILKATVKMSNSTKRIVNGVSKATKKSKKIAKQKIDGSFKLYSFLVEDVGKYFGQTKQLLLTRIKQHINAGKKKIVDGTIDELLNIPMSTPNAKMIIDGMEEVLIEFGKKHGALGEPFYKQIHRISKLNRPEYYDDAIRAAHHYLKNCSTIQCLRLLNEYESIFAGLIQL